MAIGKYSPTVHGAYQRNQHWFVERAEGGWFDPDGYDGYGYDENDRDRVGHQEHDYNADPDLYQRVLEEWQDRSPVGVKYNEPTFDDLAEQVIALAKKKGMPVGHDISDVVRQLKNIHRRATLTPNQSICEECDETINKYAMTCPECGYDRTR